MPPNEAGILLFVFVVVVMIVYFFIMSVSEFLLVALQKAVDRPNSLRL